MIPEMMINRKEDGDDATGARGEAWSWGGHRERRVLMLALQEVLGAGLWVSKPGGQETQETNRAQALSCPSHVQNCHSHTVSHFCFCRRGCWS